MSNITIDNLSGLFATASLGTVSVGVSVPVAGAVVTFTTSVASTTVTVNHQNHGATVGSFVIFSNVSFENSAFNALAALLTGEFEITSTAGGSYNITIASNAGFDLVSSGIADADYLLNAGSSEQILGTGWGADSWGSGGWGLAASDAIVLTEELRIWSQDNFGEDLILLPRNGELFYWDKTNGLDTRAFPIFSF